MLYLSAQIKIIGRDVFCLPFFLHHITPSFYFIAFLSLFHNICEVFRVKSSCMLNTIDATKWTGVELHLLTSRFVCLLPVHYNMG